MQAPRHHEGLAEVRDRLNELLDSPATHLRRLDAGADAIVSSGEVTFVIEYKNSASTGQIAAAVRQLTRYAAQTEGDVVPLVAVPFMGPVGRELCEEAGVSWLDLSGNADIRAPGLRILIEGKPNRFKGRGRPGSAFAPKSARIARWLLMHPTQSMIQRELARATDMDEGFTSRIVAKLEEDELLVRDQEGAVRPRDPGLLLDAWRQDYDFSKHRILRGHVPARSGELLMQRVASELADGGAGAAFTALPAAWLMTGFAAFRLVTVYLDKGPSSDSLERLGFREDDSGANLWLVTPNDEGVFHGASEHEGISCVHPVQAYLDLLSHPERAQEAAERVRAEELGWNDRD